MNNPQFPEVYATSAIGLGAPKQYFPIKKMNRLGNLVAALLLLGGSLVVLLYGAYDTYLAYQKHGPAMIDDKLITPLIVSVVAFLLALLAGWAAYVNWNRGVALYERGFVVRDRKGLQAWRWEEVLSLTSAIVRHYTNGIYTGTTHVYTLYNRQNARLVLNDVFTAVEALAKGIEESIFPLLYESASAQYNSGQALVFGPVTVNKAGIQIGKKTYPWAEVKEVSIHQGIVKVSKKDGGWFSGASAASSTIPNLRVLLSIINQVVGLKAG